MMRVPPSREVVAQQAADLEELVDVLVELVRARRRLEVPTSALREAIGRIPSDGLAQLVGVLLFEVADARPIQ